MNQGLFESRGAQPIKPSRWKPLWTDRFFTGYVSNRSPFRSPLSVVYSDSYNLGRSDTILAGVNSEISPRLTPIRRPGNPAYTTTTFPDSPNTFYSFKLANGEIIVMVDTATGVYSVTPTAKTLVHTKTGTEQSNFCGIGNTLYWNDGTQAKAWNPISNSVENMGILVSPALVGNVSNSRAIGSATSIPGVDFTAGGYVSTTTQLNNPQTMSIECLIHGVTSTDILPIVSFESAQTGVSGTTYQEVHLDNGALVYTYFDGTTQHSVSGGLVNDGLWHQIAVSVQYTSDVTNAISYAAQGPAKQSSGGSQNLNPDAVVVTNVSYTTSPSFSSAPAQTTLQIFLYIDGVQVASFYPQTTFATGLGYWRIARSSTHSGKAFAGVIAEVSIRRRVITGVKMRFNALMLTGGSLPQFGTNGLPVYEYTIANSTADLLYWWKLNETSGTVAADSNGTNTGTYHATVSLNATSTVQYVAYALSTAFTLGQKIIDTNGNLQSVAVAGTSGSVAPAWSTIAFTNTVDGTITWENLGQYSVNLTSSRKYYFALVTENGHFSNVSPVPPQGMTAQTGGLMDVYGFSSGDQSLVAYIAIFATVDGGTTPFFLDMIPANPTGPSGGIWHYIDNSSDNDLNILMAGPQALSNNAPPYGIRSMVFHLGRVWGAVGNILYTSGGPDTLVGDGNQAWPPANSWNYSSQIIRLVPHSTGLVVLTTSGVFLHAGGPAISQFYPQPLFPQIGIANWNALDASLNEITLFSTGKQALTIDLLNNTLTDIGFNIQDRLQTLDPTQVYVVRHHGGLDDAVFVGDGSTGWYKCVPKQPPDHSITGPIWSPKAEVLA